MNAWRFINCRHSAFIVSILLFTFPFYDDCIIIISCFFTVHMTHTVTLKNTDAAAKKSKIQCNEKMSEHFKFIRVRPK